MVLGEVLIVRAMSKLSDPRILADRRYFSHFTLPRLSPGEVDVPAFKLIGKLRVVIKCFYYAEGKVQRAI